MIKIPAIYQGELNDLAQGEEINPISEYLKQLFLEKHHY